MDMIFLGRARQVALVANENAEVANQWAAYARQLEDLLREAQANLCGARAVRDAALAEVGRLDPKNRLMSKENRIRIGQAAYEAEMQKPRGR